MSYFILRDVLSKIFINIRMWTLIKIINTQIVPVDFRGSTVSY